MDKKKNKGFTSRYGLIISMIAGSVGLGNLWRFPRMAALYGGDFRPSLDGVSRPHVPACDDLRSCTGQSHKAFPNRGIQRFYRQKIYMAWRLAGSVSYSNYSLLLCHDGLGIVLSHQVCFRSTYRQRYHCHVQPGVQR